MSCRVIIVLVLFVASCHPRISGGDRRQDVEVITTKGVIVLRLSDSTPLHRDNFLKLVKLHYYDGVTFHRTIKKFMIQSGDPSTRALDQSGKRGRKGKDTSDGPGYTIPSEFRASLYHKRGALGAAREGDAVNPTRASSGSQFYIVQGKKFTDAGLDSLEAGRLKGRKIPIAEREVYRSQGGAPHLDTQYTVFGEVLIGMEVVDSVAGMATSGAPMDRPLNPVRILKMRLIKRSAVSVK